MNARPKPPQPKELLRRFGYKPKKRLGQHFLTDTGSAARIAALATQLSYEGAPMPHILEIGPGTGTLTRALLDRDAVVTAIEIDPDMVHILREREDLATASIIQADALEFDYESFAAAGPWRVTGNLPYNIATPLIMRFIELKCGPETLIVMVQKDVAARFAARPSTRAYGSLSLAVQYAMTVERTLTLGPPAFYPRPKIDSTVLVLRRRDQPAVMVADEELFLKVVRAAFAYRRKTLANSLSLALGIERKRVSETLQRLGYSTEIRGEQLALADFARLVDQLSA